MSKELYFCNIELSKNDIKKLLKIFGGSSVYKKYIMNTNAKYELTFYEDYFMYVSDEEIKYLYSDFTNVIETDNDFYLTNDNIVIYLPKRDMDYKFIGFIRKSFENIDNRIGEEIGIKEVSKFHDSKLMSKLLFISFVITIISLFLAFGTWYLVVDYYNVDDFLRNTYRWVMLFFLPIPVVTTVLGWIYYQKGHSCMKNIVTGAIVFFVILGFGVSAFKENKIILQLQKEMSYLNNYVDIMKISDIPKKGSLYYIENSECFISDDVQFNCNQLFTYIEDYEKFESSLFKSEYWVLDKNISEDMRDFYVEIQIKSYRSFYNKTTNEYNIIPRDKGIYDIYIMEYVPEIAYLSIKEFEYEIK